MQLKQFNPTESTINASANKTIVTLKGHRSGKPSKRFTLKSAKLKIISAKITSYQKNTVIDHEVNRINCLPTFNETRLHTASLMYPGQYEIELRFGPAVNLEQLNDIPGLFV